MSTGSRHPARLVVAAVLLPVIALVAVVALWPRAASDRGVGVSHHAVVAQSTGDTPAADAARSPILDGAVRLDPPPDSPLGSRPETSLAEAAGTDPDQTARVGAQGLGAPREPIAPDAVALTGDLGGCRAEYGTDGQCLPSVPPSQAEHAREMVDAGLDPASMEHPWRCAELRGFFPDGIAVRIPGDDPLLLDTDGDGVACGIDD